MALAVVENVVRSHTETVRPVSNFSPSLWGDRFTDYKYDTQLADEISKAIEVLKDDVKSKLASTGSKLLDTMNLIDKLERLGISYHFENEIEEKLEQLFNLNTNYEDESYDLYTIAVHFRLFRQHGHRISCDVFSKFKEGNGKFREALNSDANGLLSLYEAAHLRIHGEDILEEALAFTTTSLNSIAANLSPLLRKKVLHALVQPLHFGYPRIQARNLIMIYDDDESLLKFAKLDYNLLQMLHKKELQEILSWWNELDFASKLPYARERVVECFFWSVGIYHEPQYSRARVMLTKNIVMISVIDDTYDAYGTIDELDIFTEAVERWDISEIDHLPEYTRPLYKALLELYEQFGEELIREGRSYAMTYAVESLKEMVKSYHVESQWFIGGYLPSFAEYMQNALITGGVNCHTVVSLLGCKSITMEDFKWLSKNPKMLQAGKTICRVIDDIATYEVADKITKAIEVLKDDVKSKLTSSGGSKLDTMNLIDSLERLGISYHFENEIEQKLEQFFNMDINYEDESYDLYNVAVHFRVFRHRGYRISCEVFSKFKDVNGKFHEAHKSNAKGLLSLYEAAHLRIHGEDILEEALAFATTNLKSTAPNLDSRLRKQVLHALVQPLHLGYRRIEQRNFISIYDADESLLKFAELDYNLVQMLHKKELQELSSWWKELDFVSILPYARDRMVECFFWATGIYYEPHYSRARIMLTKVIAMISIADDTYDAYGTIEELDILTKAIERWDISEIDRLPEYIRPFYKALLELYEEFGEELIREGRSYATSYSIESLKELVRCYQVEAKWFIEGYLPSFDEYLQNALITCTYCYLKISSLIGCKSATRKDFKWLSKKPKIVHAGLIICRTIDDIATYEVEKDMGQIATGIECYMKENWVTKEDAMNKFLEMAINAWKDTNEECPKPYNSSSRDVRMKIVNFATLLDVTYKNNED